MILIEIRYLNIADITALPYLIQCALSVFLTRRVHMPHVFRPIYITQLCHHILLSS